MADPKFDLSDETIFGNEAAEDEQEEVFKSYVLQRGEVGPFTDPARPIAFARAYKGEGKTALLRLAQSSLSPDSIVLGNTATALAPSLQTDDFALWVRSWKQAMLGRLASEIGAQIGMAWSDDAMALVEEAEKTGFKKHNILTAVLRRLPGITLNAGTASMNIAAPSQPGTSNPEALLRRWSKDKVPIWLFLDDVDQNFQNTPVQKAKVASFFVACREIVNAIPQIHVRAAIRPNVWTTIKVEFEALSHVEQYAFDLSWSEDQIRQLLAKRIEGYLQRTKQWEMLRKQAEGTERDKKLIGLVFEPNMKWGRGSRPPHVVLYTLSKHRPRWAIELCRIASAKARGEDRRRITLQDVLANLHSFGRRRIEDTISEFRSQCAEVDELIAAFNREPEELSTAELLSVIDRKIMNHLSPRIAGTVGAARALDVAQFLFEIGLYYAREDIGEEQYRHITYSERPHLLRSRTSLDDGLKWEIHPVYRQALEIRDTAGRERREDRRGRR
jgi:hypothetical protein